MIRLFFIGDGERDHASVPPLVETLLGTQIDAKTASWSKLRLHSGKKMGCSAKFARRLLYAMDLARRRKIPGVVATLDQDRTKRGERLGQLKQAREADTLAPPTAIGVADPHVDVWLLDDEKAVREGLGLPADHAVPSAVKVGSPKDALLELHAQGSRSAEQPVDALPHIAKHVQLKRCPHAKETGFEAFVADLQNHLGPLVPGSKSPR